MSDFTNFWNSNIANPATDIFNNSGMRDILQAMSSTFKNSLSFMNRVADALLNPSLLTFAISGVVVIGGVYVIYTTTKK
jgi:hypothetical protein